MNLDTASWKQWAPWEGAAMLLVALRCGTLEECRQLLSGGVDSDEMFKINNVLQPAIHIAVERRSIDFVGLLLESGCAVDRRDSTGRTALILAIDLGYHRIAELLLVHRADVNLQDAEGCSPLHHAIRRRSIRTIKLLTERGADVSRRDAEGNTPLLLIHEAPFSSVFDYEIISLLLQHGARADETNRKGVGLLCRVIGSLNFQFQTVELLLQSGARPDLIVRHQTRAPVHLVILTRNAAKWKCLEAMLQHGCDVNLKSMEKQTPLHMAVQMRDLRSVQILMRAGADPNSLDSLGVSPLRQAFNFRNTPLVFMLVNGGARISGAEFDSIPVKTGVFTDREIKFLYTKFGNAMTLKESSRKAIWKLHGPHTLSWLGSNPNELPATLANFVQFDSREDE